MIIQEIKNQIKEAMLAKESVKRDILRLVFGQVQQSGDESDEAVIKVIKKIIKSNNETINALAEMGLESSESGTPIISDESIKILEENNVLLNFVPKPMSEEEIKQFIKDKGIDLLSAKNSGQAMGMLMKPLKASGKEIDSSIVKKVIADIKS